MKIKNSIIDISVLFGIMLMLFYSSDPLIYPDSNRYLSGNLHDPPLYSSIIYVMQLTFGTLNSVIVLQTIFIGFSIIYFVRTLTTQFNLDLTTKTIVSLFLFMPIIQFYRHLLTESFSYAFSLLFVSFIFKLIYDLNYKNLIWSTIFVIVLLLTRNQFIFLYPVILLLYLGILILHNSKKTLSWLIISFLSIVLIHNSVLNLNRYINQDSFKNQNSSDRSAFLFTFIDAIYISSSKDIKSFENQNIQKTLTKIFEEMDRQKALIKYYNGRGHFGLSLKDIRIYSKPLLENLAIQEKTDMISLKKEISIKLITANFEKYIKHIFKKFYDSAWLFVFVPFFMLLASLINFIKHKSHFSLLVLFLSTFALANHSIVYLFGRVQPRYFIYTDFILLIFIFLTFSILLKKKYKKFI